MARATVIRVILSATDGEVLESFIVVDEDFRNPATPIQLAARVRDAVERKFETED